MIVRKESMRKMLITIAHLRRRINGELEFALLAELAGQPLHEQSSEAATSAAAERMKDEEALYIYTQNFDSNSPAETAN